MMNRTPGTGTLRSISLAVLGGLLIGSGLLLAPGYTCTDVGSVGEPPGGFALIGIQHGDLAWTPDGGINTCRIDLAILLAPGGALLGTLGIWRLNSS